MYHRILVGYDGSPAGRKAFDAALELAAKHGAELHVLTVCRTLDIGDDVETEAVIEHSRQYHRRLLAELEDLGHDQGREDTLRGRGRPPRRADYLSRRQTPCRPYRCRRPRPLQVRQAGARVCIQERGAIRRPAGACRALNGACDTRIRHAATRAPRSRLQRHTRTRRAPLPGGLACPAGDGRAGRFPAAAAASGFATVLNRCFSPENQRYIIAAMPIYEIAAAPAARSTRCCRR